MCQCVVTVCRLYILRERGGEYLSTAGDHQSYKLGFNIVILGYRRKGGEYRTLTAGEEVHLPLLDAMAMSLQGLAGYTQGRLPMSKGLPGTSKNSLIRAFG